MRTVLCVAGVALGVAVFVSIRLANRGALGSFARTVDAVAGRANLQVAAGSAGLDERLFLRVRSLPGVEAAAPVIQAYAPARVGAPRPDERSRLFERADPSPYPETLLVLGVDLLRERAFGRWGTTPGTAEGNARAAIALLADPSAVAITRALAGRLGLQEGDSLTILASGIPVPLTVRAVLHGSELEQALGGNVAVCDIAVAQEVFRRWGSLDRIDLIVEPARRDGIRAEVAALLPPYARVELPESRTRQVENLLEAFALNLTALSFIALFVAAFLIYNAVSMSVVRRRGEVGILRSLGQTRVQVLLQFLAEAALLGAVGGVAGVLLGTALARFTLAAVSRTVSALYILAEARAVTLDGPTAVLGVALGIGAALAAALAPALEAARTAPSAAAREGAIVPVDRNSIVRWSVGAAAFLLLALLASVLASQLREPRAGFVSALLLLCGFALLAPATTIGAARAVSVLQPVLGIAVGLGARAMREAVARTGVVVAALMVSVAMIVGLSIMVGSFRQTVDTWVTQTIRGDLYVEPLGRHVSGAATRLDAAVQQAARGLPGVEAVDTYRGQELLYGGRIAYVAGIEFAVQRDYGRLQLLEGDSRVAITRALVQDGALISESFAHRHRLRSGDTLRLETPSGPAALAVCGVFRDYASDAGLVMLDRRLYARLWQDERTESLALYLRSGTHPDDVRAALLQRVPRGIQLAVTPNQALRRRVLDIFDQTFQITYALQAIAVLVAVLGVVGTLTSLILQRGRELGVLRAVGALRSQVYASVLTESALLGATGSLLGCVCGVLLSLLLVFVLNKQFFGWSIQLHLDPWLFPQVTALITLVALAAGAGPARLAAGRQAAEAMRSE